MTFAEQLVKEIDGNPILKNLNALAFELAGVHLTLVVRRRDGPFDFMAAGAPPVVPEFCRVITADQIGHRRCMLCQSMIAIGTAGQPVEECPCHSGVSVMAVPVAIRPDEGISDIHLTTGAFRRGDASAEWKNVLTCMKGLSLDRNALRKNFNSLPQLDARQVRLVRSLMECARLAVADLVKRIFLDWRREHEVPGPQHHASKAEEEILAAMLLANDMPLRSGASPQPPIVRVVTDVVRGNPSLPFTVADIARAARITPNYFSALFHHHTGKNFKDFLLETRMKLAERLLHDLTLSVSEVAEKAGFEDASYFARCFHRTHKLSPRAWRERL
ncbi:MAG: hypothetical protein C0404_06175 [Verrucomicrobia bacterium]|nr:hypothetical protein [Verrucomicrobiota bacterium]